MNLFDEFFKGSMFKIAQYNFMCERADAIFESNKKAMNNNPCSSGYLHVTNLVATDVTNSEDKKFCVSGFGQEGDALNEYTIVLMDEYNKFLFQRAYEVLEKYIIDINIKHFSIKNCMLNQKERKIKARYNEQYKNREDRTNNRHLIKYLVENCCYFKEYQNNNLWGNSIIDMFEALSYMRHVLVHELNFIPKDRYNSNSKEVKEIIEECFKIKEHDKGYYSVELNKYSCKKLMFCISSISFFIYKCVSKDCEYEINFGN